MENVKQKFFQSHFLQPDHKGFIKDVEVRMIDKTQVSHPTKRKFYWMRILKTLYPDGLNIEGAISNFYVFASKLQFSFPWSVVNRCRRTNSLIAVTVLFLVMLLVAFVEDTKFGYLTDFNYIVTYYLLLLPLLLSLLL